MGSARVVAGVCGQLDEVVFELRQTIPLTWQGAAADEFAARVEEAAGRLIDATGVLHSAARLIETHERRMEAMRLAMGQGG